MSSVALLATVRVVLCILTATILATALYAIVQYHVRFSSQYWPIWLPMFLAIISNIVYAVSCTKRTYLSAGFRNLLMFLIALVWFVSPSYRIHLQMQLYGGSQFFSGWNCGLRECTLMMTLDICGLLVGVVGLLEVFLAYRYERTFAQKSAPTTTIFLAPGAQQQTAYVQLEQQHQQQPVVSPYIYQHHGYDQAQPQQVAPYYAQPTTATSSQPPHY
ncbi:hypothetical protein BG011_006213 [Mortierella polycephala]|uniref:MARVEL domain-containing protein n=1 Tax=Mortierella polycephala TaxID=41804 RepID=A0A9P6U0A5_9FUNG|nr:hypothetical protein BG011_006213 [Mortierella polycephala]